MPFCLQAKARISCGLVVTLMLSVHPESPKESTKITPLGIVSRLFVGHRLGLFNVSEDGMGSCLNLHGLRISHFYAFPMNDRDSHSY